MFSIATAPAKQSVSETIAVYSGRLGSAVLLEDRRAAIIGLRSFAKQYPASVASGALRSLIGSLSKDGEDVDTVKLVLETLLMLFNPNEDSPEASEEIALWLADEFTQRQENITLLLDFLDTYDFYSRLYSLQLLSAILAARTERTEECVFNARLGISRLVAILDDRREAVRNEAITLLTYLTPTSLEIQKLVAFENAFDRVFGIIEAEGGLAEGGQVVEDCLILLANLLRLNSSNQALFRETGCVPRLSKLLETAYKADGDDGDEVAPWAQVQKSRNIYALLAVIRLFLVSGAVGTAQNQASLFQHGLLFHALQLAFGRGAEIPIRSEVSSATSPMYLTCLTASDTLVNAGSCSMCRHYKGKPEHSGKFCPTSGAFATRYASRGRRLKGKRRPQGVRYRWASGPCVKRPNFTSVRPETLCLRMSQSLLLQAPRSSVAFSS